MRRFLVPRSSWGEAIALPAQEAHHALRVLRLRPGDEAVVFDGEGLEVTVRLTELGPEGGQAVRIGEARRVAGALQVVLGQGLPKGDKLEEILQHTTELGVTEVCPLALARSISRPDPGKLAGKLERWRRIAGEAAKQSRRADVPEVRTVETLEAFCRRFEAEGSERRGLVLYEQAPAEAGLKPVLERWSDRRLERVWLLVGPEGGLLPDEVECARRAGFEVVGLGPRILRTETAGMAVIAVLQYLFG